MTDLPPPPVEVVPMDSAAQTDPWVVRLVVVALSLLSLGALGSMTWLISTGQSAETIVPVVSLGSAGAGALSAVLVSTRSRG